MARTSLPPGYRFHPTHVELVKFYLKRKVMGKKLPGAICELNIYKYSPWDLPDKSCLRSRDLQWYFFCPKERKYASGARTRRAAEGGFWKSTGKDRPVCHNDQTLGMIKTLVFHEGRAPEGKRTDWVMHEYRIVDQALADAGVVQDAYVLCKVFQKSGQGPKNGEQYGAPFNEEDWDDDDEVCFEALAFAGHRGQSTSGVTSTGAPGSAGWRALSEPSPSNPVPSAEEVSPLVPNTDDDDVTAMLGMFTDDDDTAMLGMFTNDDLFSFYDNTSEMLQNVTHDTDFEGPSHLGGNDICNDLGDQGNWCELNEGECTLPSQMNGYGLCPLPAFLELNDLNYPLGYAAESSGPQELLTNGLWEPYQCNHDLVQREHFASLKETFVREADNPGTIPAADWNTTTTPFEKP